MRRIPEECKNCPLRREFDCEVYTDLFPFWGREELRKEGMCPGKWRYYKNKEEGVEEYGIG